MQCVFVSMVLLPRGGHGRAPQHQWHLGFIPGFPPWYPPQTAATVRYHKEFQCYMDLSSRAVIFCHFLSGISLEFQGHIEM